MSRSVREAERYSILDHRLLQMITPEIVTGPDGRLELADPMLYLSRILAGQAHIIIRDTSSESHNIFML